MAVEQGGIARNTRSRWRNTQEIQRGARVRNHAGNSQLVMEAAPDPTSF